ncbi:MAG: molybdopterin-guanine dinucleotide biosynthesis protein B [Desulfobacterales bacterium]|nr:molybdopterin-guanine dinucleotide biosynthesis protein B [Desulfobacterales bacterium]
MPKVFLVVGNSGAGKTTLIEKLVPELKSRGYKIGTVKHASHGFDIDKEGKDSFRHFNSGADTVLLVGPSKIAMIKNEKCENLELFIDKYFVDSDIVIVEGFKKENLPQIHIFRSSINDVPKEHNNLIALVTDMDIKFKCPVFKLEDISNLADLIEKYYE